MCKNNPQEQSFFGKIKDAFSLKLNSALADYNAIRPHIEKLTLQNEADQGALIEGPTAMVKNRLNGAYALYQSPQAFYRAGVSGFMWGSYFAQNKDLTSDVHHSGMTAIYSHLWPLSVHGIATAAVTGMSVSTGGLKELEAQAKIRYEQKRNALVVSTGLSVGVTQVFKQAGTYMKTDLQRFMLRGAKGSWQVTGMMGLFYGLSRLNDSMDDCGVFGVALKEKRDKFFAAGEDSTRNDFELVVKDPVLKG
jgi:hypothetical protein